MADFVQLAKAIGQKNQLDTDEQLAEIKQQKNVIAQMFNMSISQLELQKAEQKNVDNQISFEQKRSKLRSDLLKQAIDGSEQAGPVAVGGDLLQGLAPQVDQDAAGLPLIDQQGQRQI